MTIGEPFKTNHIFFSISGLLQRRSLSLSDLAPAAAPPVLPGGGDIVALGRAVLRPHGEEKALPNAGERLAPPRKADYRGGDVTFTHFEEE